MLDYGEFSGAGMHVRPHHRGWFGSQLPRMSHASTIR
jgi:hypothetical protein